jgi:hypothetical protein
MAFEGTEGTIYVDRKHIEATPPEILNEKIGDNEIHLYESADHYRNFLDSVKSRKDPICTAEIGHRSATICNIGNIAMRLGRKLAWDPAAERFTSDDEANTMLGRTMRGDWKLDV